MTLKQILAIRLSDAPGIDRTARILTLVFVAFLIAAATISTYSFAGIGFTSSTAFNGEGFLLALTVLALEYYGRYQGRMIAGIVYFLYAFPIGVAVTSDRLPSQQEFALDTYAIVLRYTLPILLFCAAIVCLASASKAFEKRRSRQANISV